MLKNPRAMTVVWGFVYEVQAKEFGYQRCDLKDSVIIIITTIGLNLFFPFLRACHLLAEDLWASHRIRALLEQD